jgi:hypothetical protein
VVKPSVQTCLVLEAMATVEQKGEEKWEQMMKMMDRVVKKLDTVEAGQHRLEGQAELSATVARKAEEERTILARQMEETGKVVAQLRLEMMAKDLEGDGAGSSRESADQGDQIQRRREPQQERVREEDQVMGGRGHPSLPKYSFPRFQGKEPGIWLAKCQDYFTIYQVPEALWAISASMHMEGNAARWLQVYKMRQGLGNWMQFGRAVRAKFGVEEYPKAMRHLLNLYQKNGVEEYAQEFEEARYATAVHNPGMDEIFFVNQFVKGLKTELQGGVMCHLPQSVDRAVILAHMQQEILEKNRLKMQRSITANKAVGSNLKTDNKGGFIPGDLTKERQLREFRRANGLCFTCGEKFEPGHQGKCPKRVVPQLHVLTVEDMGMVLTDPVLEHLESEDKEVEELYKLSLNAISGMESDGCMRVQGFMHNQMLVVLIDSSSSLSFVSQNLVDKMGLPVQKCAGVEVKVANGEKMRSDKKVVDLEWWFGGHTYTTTLRVLELDMYDLILGFDWLKKHSPMQCDWLQNVLTFVDKGVIVQLRGDAGQHKEVPQISILQVNKWLKGNVVWALVMLEQVVDKKEAVVPEQLQRLLVEFEDIFDVPTGLPPSRDYDHHISLVPGHIPMNSRPYRYSPLHKTEIEK